MNEMREILEKLVGELGISGSERSVSDLIEKEMKGRVDELRKDKLGNLIARKGSGKPKIMLAAHMDEIGFRVKYIDKKGFLRFVKVGGIDDRTLLNQRVLIYGKQKVKGIIGAKPPHLQKEEDRKKVVECKDMFIDIGASSREEAEKAEVKIGDPIAFDRPFSILQGELAIGKAFDNRVGCAILMGVLKQFKGKETLHGVWTVQEEVGLKGARTAAYALDPDLAIALDTTTAGDTPELEEGEATTELGKGPAITVAEAGGRGLITDKRILNWLIESAKKAKVPYQLEAGEGGMTDSAAIYISKTGVPCGTISIPTRYIHGPGEVLSLKDVENAIKLISIALDNLDSLNITQS
jgi:endoglucanase